MEILWKILLLVGILIGGVLAVSGMVSDQDLVVFGWQISRISSNWRFVFIVGGMIVFLICGLIFALAYGDPAKEAEYDPRDKF